METPPRARTYAAYNVYDKAETIKDAAVLIARFTATGTFDPISAAILLSEVLPFGKHLGKLAFSGKYLTGANKALESVYTQARISNLPTNKVSELVGEVGAGLVANAMKLKPTNFPLRYHGVDGIFERGGKLIIVESKGGGANLTNNQMSKAWIDKQIKKLRSGGNPLEVEWADKLDAAKKSNNLQGMVVTTRIDHVTGKVASPEFVLKDWSAIGGGAF